MDGKLPPHDIDAEEALLGSLLIDGTAIKKAGNIVKESDFFSERNQWIFRTCLDLFQRHEAVNQITVAQELASKNKLETCGGAAYLTYLISICPTSLDVEFYSQIVRRLAIYRRLIALSDSIANIGYQSLPNPEDAIQRSCMLMDNFRRENAVTNKSVVTPMMAGNSILELIDKFNKPHHCLNYGFKQLDEITAGISPELIVLGARPSIGKTQLMLDIAENNSFNGAKVLFVSAEMKLQQIQERKIARELGIDIRSLRLNGVPEKGMEQLFQIAGEVSVNNIYFIDERPSSQDIYNEAQKMKETIGLDIVFVDYLQFLRDTWDNEKENQNIRVGRACKTLKSLVKDLNIPVILASQLNRAIEYRTGESRRPTLADLRDSGNIEQDADIVFLLHRDEIEADVLSSTLKLKMAKNRQLGSAKPIELEWNKEKHRYQDS